MNHTSPPPRKNITRDERAAALEAAEAKLNQAHEILAALHWHTLDPRNARLASAVWDVIDEIEDVR